MDEDVKLTTEQVAQLRALRERIARVRTLIDRAERAHLPVAELRAQLETMERQRAGMLHEFGPQAPGF